MLFHVEWLIVCYIESNVFHSLAQLNFSWFLFCANLLHYFVVGYIEIFHKTKMVDLSAHWNLLLCIALTFSNSKRWNRSTWIACTICKVKKKKWNLINWIKVILYGRTIQVNPPPHQSHSLCWLLLLFFNSINTQLLFQRHGF